MSPCCATSSHATLPRSPPAAALRGGSQRATHCGVPCTTTRCRLQSPISGTEPAAVAVSQEPVQVMTSQEPVQVLTSQEPVQVLMSQEPVQIQEPVQVLMSQVIMVLVLVLVLVLALAVLTQNWRLTMTPVH